MATRQIKTTLTKEELTKLLRDLPGILNGTKPSRFGLHKLFWGAIAFKMFESIHDAFLIKSQGLPDELGNQWPDLSREYKAYQRPIDGIGGMITGPKGVPRNLKRRLKNNRRQQTDSGNPNDPTRAQTGLGLLTDNQYKRWKHLFGVIYHATRGRLGDGEAKSFAGQVAWTKLKKEGARTQLEVMGDRDLLILRVSDTLSGSLAPGKFDESTGYKKINRYQIFEISKGKLTIGTRVFYANIVGKRKGQEWRPIWPEEMDPWIDAAVDFALDCVMNKLTKALQQ